MENHVWHQLVFHGNGCALPLGYHCYPGFSQSFVSNCTSAPHFVSAVDLMKWEEQVLFAWQSSLGGFAEITLSNFPRLISRHGAVFFSPSFLLPRLPPEPPAIFLDSSRVSEPEKRGICNAGCPSTKSALLPARLWGGKGKMWQRGEFYPPGDKKQSVGCHQWSLWGKAVGALWVAQPETTGGGIPVTE